MYSMLLTAAHLAAFAAAYTTNRTNLNVYNPSNLSEHCLPGDTLLQCATRLADALNYTSSVSLGLNGGDGFQTQAYTFKVMDYPDGIYTWMPVNFMTAWTAQLQDCKITPELVWQGSGVDCDTDSCSKSVAYTQSKTKTHTQGFSISVEASAGVDVEFLSASLKVSGTSSRTWSQSQTTEQTITNTLNMKKGDTCFPGTVQLRVDCFATSQIRHSEFYLANPAPARAMEVAAGVDAGNLCRFLVHTDDCCQSPWYHPFVVRGGDAANLCSEADGQRVNFTTYLNVQGGSEPWALFGCT